MWRPTQQEALWFHGGNLQQSRFYSLQLALQIKARAAGIATPVYGSAAGLSSALICPIAHPIATPIAHPDCLGAAPMPCLALDPRAKEETPHEHGRIPTR